MKIGITTFGCDLKSGMSRYITNLIAHFSQVDCGDNFELMVHGSAKDEYMAGSSDENIEPVNVPEWLGNPVLNVAWHQLALPVLCRRRKFDVLFLPAASRRTPIRSPCPMVGTVHDMSPFHVPGKYDPFRNFYQKRVLPRLITGLTHIVADSESTKRDILEYTDVKDERVTVVHLAADTHTFFPRDRAAAAASVSSYGVRSPYLIYTSRIESPGKNHLRLIRAFEKLKKEENIPHQLVLAGADWHGAEEVHTMAQASPNSKDILLTGYVNGKDLPYLYSGADLMVFPSLFEGFGLPILEAMACGVPVACSNVSSMPEIAGDAAILFDPFDVDSISSGMLSILESNDRAVEVGKKGFYRAAEFSWEKTASETLTAIRRAVEG